MKKRIEWVDIGKYICIMFVMLSHLESKTKVLTDFFLPFFLTCFFFLAGYVYKQPQSFRQLITKKFKGLFIPWLIYSNLNIILSSIISFKDNHKLINDLKWNVLQIRPLGDGMWFVAALFVAFIPFYFIIKINNLTIGFLISFFLSFVSRMYSLLAPEDLFPWGTSSLPWHIEYIFVAVFWMVLGYYYKNEFESALEKYDTWFVLVVVTVLYLGMIYGPIQFERGVVYEVFSYFKSIIGITFIILICKRIKTNKYVSYVGENTLILFALHGKLYAVLEKVLRSKFSDFYTMCLNNIFYSSVLAIVLTVVMSVILLIPAFCINKWLPWTVGRSKG